MSNGFLVAPRPARARVLLAVGTAVLVLVVVVVLRGAGTHRAQATPQPAVPNAAVPATGGSPTPAPASSAVPVHLVEGARRVNGVAVGYPHTQAGAVSAAVEYASQLDSTLDPDHAVAIGEAIADQADGVTPASFRQGPINSRTRLGLPTTGPVLTGASMNLGPVSYQIREVAHNRITVLLLGYMTVITPALGMRNGVAVIPCPLAWAAGDWKLRQRSDSDPDYAELRYPPGSAQAVAAGWLPVTA